MVKYADYTVLCCFVFPPGFDIPTFLALFEGRQEKGERSVLQPPEAQGVPGGAHSAGGVVGNSITLQEEEGTGPKTSANCMLPPAFPGSRWISP